MLQIIQLGDMDRFSRLECSFEVGLSRLILRITKCSKITKNSKG